MTVVHDFPTFSKKGFVVLKIPVSIRIKLEYGLGYGQVSSILLTKISQLFDIKSCLFVCYIVKSAVTWLRIKLKGWQEAGNTFK